MGPASHRLDAPEIGRLGIISDIHANLPALLAVFAEGVDVDGWVCAGDVVGYYTEPNQICELLRSRGIPTVAGNHDLYALGELRYPPERERRYRSAWTASLLSADNRKWLTSLPQAIALSGVFPSALEIVVRHATTFDFETYWYPTTPIELALAAGELLIIGHTHHPMLRPAGRGRVLNPGSVGQPRDRKPGAAYAVLDLRTGAVDFRRAAYDVTNYQNHLRRNGVCEEMVHILSRL